QSLCPLPTRDAERAARQRPASCARAAPHALSDERRRRRPAVAEPLSARVRRRRALTAAILGLAATLLVAAAVIAGGPAVVAVEWTIQDRWARPAAPASPTLVVITRDPAGEARFGAGPWDRAVLARVIGASARRGRSAAGRSVAGAAPWRSLYRGRGTSPTGRGSPTEDGVCVM